MLWLAATAPRLDTAAAHAYLSRVRPGLTNRNDNPETVFEDTLRFVLSRGAPRARSLTAAQLASALDWLAPRWSVRGWTLERMTDHRQVAPDRKRDLNPAEWGRLRAAIAARLATGPG